LLSYTSKRAAAKGGLMSADGQTPGLAHVAGPGTGAEDALAAVRVDRRKRPDGVA
jgi:hypothetical protein